MREKRKSSSSTSSSAADGLLAGEQRLGAELLDRGQQIRRARPAGADRRAQHLEGELAELVAQQAVEQAAPCLRRDARISQRPAQADLAREQIGYRIQIVGRRAERRRLAAQPGDGPADDAGLLVSGSTGSGQLVQARSHQRQTRPAMAFHRQLPAAAVSRGSAAGPVSRPLMKSSIS